jgi:hypothetical protein
MEHLNQRIRLTMVSLHGDINALEATIVWLRRAPGFG